MKAFRDMWCPLLLAALASGSATANPAGACARLSSIRLPGARVLSAELFEAGGFKTADGKTLPHQKAFCRVLGRATPASDSDIRFEVWLPAQDWNGRLWGVGNGDFAGAISAQALAGRMPASAGGDATNAV